MPAWCTFDVRVAVYQGQSLAEAKREIEQTTLAAAHRAVFESDVEEVAVTGTTDARFLGLYSGIPAWVCGPYSDSIHGFDERVDLDSTRRITKLMALFIAEWCGLEKK